jgi:hypothetical protein
MVAVTALCAGLALRHCRRRRDACSLGGFATPLVLTGAEDPLATWRVTRCSTERSLALGRRKSYRWWRLAAARDGVGVPGGIAHGSARTATPSPRLQPSPPRCSRRQGNVAAGGT